MNSTLPVPGRPLPFPLFETFPPVFHLMQFSGTEFLSPSTLGRGVLPKGRKPPLWQPGVSVSPGSGPGPPPPLRGGARSGGGGRGPLPPGQARPAGAKAPFATPHSPSYSPPPGTPRCRAPVSCLFGHRSVLPNRVWAGNPESVGGGPPPPDWIRILPLFPLLLFFCLWGQWSAPSPPPS